MTEVFIVFFDFLFVVLLATGAAPDFIFLVPRATASAEMLDVVRAIAVITASHNIFVLVTETSALLTDCVLVVFITSRTHIYSVAVCSNGVKVVKSIGSMAANRARILVFGLSLMQKVCLKFGEASLKGKERGHHVGRHL